MEPGRISIDEDIIDGSCCQLTLVQGPPAAESLVIVGFLGYIGACAHELASGRVPTQTDSETTLVTRANIGE